MNPAAKISAFVAALTASFGAAYGIGAAVGTDAGTTGSPERAEHAGSAAPHTDESREERPRAACRSPRADTRSTSGPHDWRRGSGANCGSPSGTGPETGSRSSGASTARNST